MSLESRINTSRMTSMQKNVLLTIAKEHKIRTKSQLTKACNTYLKHYTTCARTAKLTRHKEQLTQCKKLIQNCLTAANKL